MRVRIYKGRFVMYLLYFLVNIKLIMRFGIGKNGSFLVHLIRICLVERITLCLKALNYLLKYIIPNATVEISC